MKTSKDELLEIAFRLFLERGYEAVTMQDLVAASGLSKGAFHHYFHRKPELFEACVERFFTRFLPNEAVLAPSGFSTKELVRTLAGMHGSLMTELRALGVRPDSYWRFVLSLPQERQAQLSEGFRAFERRMCDGFGQDKAKGLLQPEAEPGLLAREVLALLEGLGVLSATGLPEVDAIALMEAWLRRAYR